MRRPIKKIEVHISVIVVVKQGQTRGHTLNDMVSSDGTVGMGELDPRAVRDISEYNRGPPNRHDKAAEKQGTPEEKRMSAQIRHTHLTS